MIGVFDSGIGGLTVVRALLAKLPYHAITYLGDTARTPYGTKSPDTIVRYSINNIEFLLRQGARIIVIACNTASSHAYEAVRSRFDIPIFEVIGPGAALAVNRSRRMRIGVIGTRATVASRVYDEKIRHLNPDAEVFASACPLLVPLVEEGWISKPETAIIVRKYMHPLKTRQIDTLILGCTHYPVLKGIIQRKIGARVDLVDSAEAIAAKVGDYLNIPAADTDEPLPPGRLTIFVTDIAEQFRKTARLILRQPVDIHHADL